MARRADNYDGSCREILTGKLKGRWRVQFRYEKDSGEKVRIDRVFPTKTKAKEFLREQRRGERIVAVKAEKEITLAEWFEWLAENDWPEAIADVTIAYRRGRFRKYVAKTFGGTPLSQIDPLKVRAFYRELKQNGTSESLLLEIRADLVRVFNQAISPYQRIPMSVANPFRLPLQRPEPRDAVALTPDEVRKVLLSPGLTVSDRALLGVFLLAGVRLGEAMALTRHQILFDTGLIVIDRAVQVAYGGKQSIGLPKGGRTRNAVMCSALSRLIQAHCIDLEPDDYLWSADHERKPRMKKVMYAAWKRIASVAELPPSMSPHDCRLTHINLIEKLMPAVSTTTLKEHVGHASSGVTEASYTRPLTTAQAILRHELDRVLDLSFPG